MFDTHIKDGAVQFYVILMTCAGSLPTNFLKQLFHCRSLCYIKVFKSGYATQHSISFGSLSKKA
jgi:hypothetical protein